ncbi:hypothetical protein B0H12DRAFT_1116235 [Mycena haematopus]|nr:hypothetical protein B0H12DRAFT_1116235 [Mycena haematopus]
MHLSDLPIDILLTIIEDPAIPTKTLYFLALLSRRLNYIALPIYFSRNNIDLENTTITLYTDRHDILSALQICLFISSMHRVQCILPHPNCSTIFPFLKQMKRVETFFSRLTSVKEVILQLDHTRGHRCLAPGSDEVLHAWATQLRDLLSCIVERGCTSLTVVNGSHLIEAYQLHPPTFPLQYLPRLVRKVLLPQNIKTLGFRRNPRQGTADYVSSVMSWSSSSLLQLDSLNIESTTLIVPPGLHWTLTALRQSCITSLGIRLSLVEPQVWSIVLPLIACACPNLTTLSLKEIDSGGGSHDAPSETLALEFLARFPRLVDVELTHLWGAGLRFNRYNHLHRTRGPTVSAKHLVRLRAPANIVAHLLSRPFGLPMINVICVLWDAESHAHLQTLIRFLSSICRMLAWRRLTPELSLWIESLSGFLDDMAALRELSARQLEQFTSVERLHLENAFLPGSPTRPFLKPAIAAFRSLKHISVTTRAGDGSVARLLQWATDVLKSIEINGKSYDLASRS